MLNAKSYGRVADMAAVRSSIMNVFDIYSEAMISAAYEEAEKEEGFAELPVSDKTKACLLYTSEKGRTRPSAAVKPVRW